MVTFSSELIGFRHQSSHHLKWNSADEAATRGAAAVSGIDALRGR